jgi:hypothetical protein
MTMSRTLSGWIMQLATRRPPPTRADWVLAMDREFETLERGRLGWALGCLTTRIGWTLRAQWLYLLLLLLSPFYIRWVGHLEFTLFWSHHEYIGFERNYGALIALIEPLPLAILLGFYRPDRIRTTLVLGCILAQHVGMTLGASWTLGGTFLSWWGPHATIYMAPPLIGLCASLWVWYMGASFGAWLARRRTPPSAPFSSAV